MVGPPIFTETLVDAQMDEHRSRHFPSETLSPTVTLVSSRIHEQAVHGHEGFRTVVPPYSGNTDGRLATPPLLLRPSVRAQGPHWRIRASHKQPTEFTSGLIKPLLQSPTNASWHRLLAAHRTPASGDGEGLLWNQPELSSVWELPHWVSSLSHTGFTA